MDAGDESIIEGPNPVGCEEEDALAVFHCTEEAYMASVNIVLLYGGLVLVDMKAVRNG